MRLSEKFEKGVIFRLLLSIVLACVALGLFLLSRTSLDKPLMQTKEDFAVTQASVDREIDSVLVRFGIEREWIHKRKIALANSTDSRIERRVMIPPTIPSVQMNVALNTMARRYNGRAVATENLKENSVTIHIELEKKIVQTIILVLRTDLKRGGHKIGQARI